ncbi:MAG: PilT/PilU family type 4a pilus ATPase, partial [Planctomycetes bacterium]|nr:PilT/PilU family type 4a pilus ATPase [Planctomycetota bacterium]
PKKAPPKKAPPKKAPPKKAPPKKAPPKKAPPKKAPEAVEESKFQAIVPSELAEQMRRVGEVTGGPAFVLVPVSQLSAALAKKMLTSFNWEPREQAEEEIGEQLQPVGVRTPSPAGERLDAMLEMARGCGASDLHLVVGQAPLVRVNGDLRYAQEPVLQAPDLIDLLKGGLSKPQLGRFTETGDLDWCHIVGDHRYRANACKGRAGPSMTFRVIHQRIPSIAELQLPPAINRLVTYNQGLILVTGPLGAGKTTTLVSLVDLVNKSRPDHIISCEDPVEFLIRPDKSQVSQRALGEDTISFANALRGALREDPDVLMIGDLRDYETASLAISASETGHLVLASMPSMSAVKTLDKLIDLFPADEQDATRGMVSESLRGLICQRLIPGVSGLREVAVELLFNSVAVANVLRDGTSSKLVNAMQMGRSQGMITLEDSLRGLLDAGKITEETFELELAR